MSQCPGSTADCLLFCRESEEGAEMLSDITRVINCGNYADDAEQTVRNAVKALLKCVKDKSTVKHYTMRREAS